LARRHAAILRSSITVTLCGSATSVYAPSLIRVLAVCLRRGLCDQGQHATLARPTARWCDGKEDEI
jgi:hypothetical protein